MKRDVCILLSTCDRHRPVAEWTASRIERDWPNHPPIIYAGLDDPRDLMTVNLAGAHAACREGFRWIYLILDDHPPVGLCREDILNETLPDAAEKLSVVNIGLLGWGQRRGEEGAKLGKSGAYLLRNSASYRWKFSLHPALWSADALRELLFIRLSQFATGERTPWNFERHRDLADGPVPARLLENTYRVEGNAMASGNRGLDAVIREPLLLAFDLWRFLLRLTRGQSARDAYDRDHLWAYHYYRGPYPILWSGALRAGRPSRDFENFLRFSRRKELLREWQSVRSKLETAC